MATKKAPRLIEVEVKHICGHTRRYQKRKGETWAQDLQLRRWRQDEAGKICHACLQDAQERNGRTTR